MDYGMSCIDVAKFILAYPDWLTAFFILFVAAAFGASVTVVFYEFRYRRGIWHQKREEEIAKAFRDTQGWS